MVLNWDAENGAVVEAGTEGATNYWVAQLESGAVTRSEAIIAIMNGAQGDDATILDNRADVAIQLAEGGISTEQAKSDAVVQALLTITADPASKDTAKDTADTAIVANNNAPELADMTAVEYTENVTVAAGTVVATATATDADDTETYTEAKTYSMTGDNRFAIDASTGEITVVADTTFDYETETTVTLTVTVSDGMEESSKDLTINIADVAPSYTFEAEDTTAKDGDTINFTFTATEAPDLTEVTYTISGVEAADVVGAKLTGTATVTDGVADIPVTLLATAANAGKTVTVTVNDGTTDYVASVPVSAAETPVQETISLTQIVEANDAGENIIRNADVATEYTIASDGLLGDADGDRDGDGDASVIIGGDANLIINSGSGEDRLVVDGTGNNVVNAGDGIDMVVLSDANNVVIIEDDHFDAGSSIIGDKDGVNTLVISGENDITGGTITNIQNMVLNSDADVTLGEDELALMTSIVSNAGAELTLSADTETETIDLRDVLVGEMAKLTIANNVAIQLSAAQIENIDAFVNNGTIITDEAGAQLLADKGVPYSIEGSGDETLKTATADNLANVSNLNYEFSVTAEEAYDQIQLNGTAAAQISDTGATINITDTATVAQAKAIVAAVNDDDVNIGDGFAVADTATNIAANVDNDADSTNNVFLNSEYITSLTLTTAAKVSEAQKIFKVAASNGTLMTEVADAAADDEDTEVLEKPAYDVKDTATAVATAYNDAIITAASSVELTTAATKAEITNILSTLSSKLVDGYSITDTAANAYGLSTSIRNGATDISVTDVASVAQASRVDSFDNSGDTSFAVISDSATSLYGASTTLLDKADAVTLSVGETLNTVQAIKLVPYFNDDYSFTIEDSATNLTSANLIALVEGLVNNADFTGSIVITPTNDLTLAQADTLTELAGLSTSISLSAHDIADSAATILDAIDDLDTMGNNQGGANFIDSDSKDAEALVDAATNINTTGNITVAQAAVLVNANIGDTVTNGMKYNIEDTATNIYTALNAGGSTAQLVTNATEVTVTTAATALQGVTIGTANLTFTVEDTLTNIAAQSASVAQLEKATTITASSTTVTVSTATTIATMNGTLTTDLEYSIQDGYSALDGETTLLAGAQSVTAIDTLTNIQSLQADTTGNNYADIDSYIITADIDAFVTEYGSNAAATTDYDEALAIHLDDANDTSTSVSEAKTEYVKSAVADIKSKLVFTDLEDTQANLIAAADDADETAVVAQASTIIVGLDADSNAAITVADLQSIVDLAASDAIINLNSNSIVLTDTVANLLTAGSLLARTNSDDGASIVVTIAATDAATSADYQTLIDMLQTAELEEATLYDATTSTDAAMSTGIVDIEDDITNVQAASEELLSTLGDTTSTNKITLDAGSEVSLTVAQATALDITTNTNTTTDDIFASDGTNEATYEIKDSIVNIINGMTAHNTLGNLVANASTVISTGGTVYGDEEADGAADGTDTYLDFLDTLVQSGSGNFDVLNSVYSIVANKTDLTNNTAAVKYATSVTVNDTVSLAEAETLNTAATTANTIATDITFSSITADIDTLLSDKDADGVPTRLGTTTDSTDNVTHDVDIDKDVAGLVAKADKVILTDANAADISVAEAAAMVSLLGEGVTVEIAVLKDTAENLAAADASLLAMAQAVTATTNATVAEATTIVAGATWLDANGDGITPTYNVTDTAANLATAADSILDNAGAVAQSATDEATIADAIAANTADTVTDVTVVDSGANIAASIEDLAVLKDTAEVDYVLVSGTENGTANVSFLGVEIAGTQSKTAAFIATAIVNSKDTIINSWNASNPTKEITDIEATSTTAELKVTYKTTEGNVADDATTAGALNGISFSDTTTGTDSNGAIAQDHDITVNSTITLADADELDAYVIDTTGDIAGVAEDATGAVAVKADSLYIEDTVANLLDGSNQEGYDNAESVTITDNVTVSKAYQISALYQGGYKNNSTLATDAAAFAKMNFNLEDAVEYMVVAFSESNEIFGYADSVTITDVGTVDVYNVSGTYYISGTATEIAALPEEVQAIGYVVKGTVSEIEANADLVTGDNSQGYIVVDSSTNISAASVSTTAAAIGIEVTDTIDVAGLTALQDASLPLTVIAELADEYDNLSGATLVDGTTTITVTDAITAAEADSFDANADEDTTIVYSISDVKASIDFTDEGGGNPTAYDEAMEIHNATSVEITDAITVAQAGLINSWNANHTLTISDVVSALDVLITEDPTEEEQDQIDALGGANSTVSIKAPTSDTVSVEIATALTALAGFDGKYTLSDSAANLAAADATLLANALEVQVTTAATIAEATILGALTNIETDANDLANFTVTDTAANIAASSADFLDGFNALTISTEGDDEVVTAAEGLALAGIIDAMNESTVDTTFADGNDNYTVVDTFANITDAANEDGVSHADATVDVNEAITVAEAVTVNTAVGSATVTYDLEDTRSHLQGATTAVRNNTDTVTVTDDVTAAQAGIVNTQFSGLTLVDDVSFGKVTGTMDELMAGSSLLINQATTVDVTDAMTVDELMDGTGTKFLNVVGDKLTGGYEVEDGVDNIVNAILNNDFSNAVVANANTVSLTGSTTMNIAASSVIIGLGNFDSSYDIADTATNISAAELTLINGADTVTVTLEDAVQENFDATAYTTEVSFVASANEAVITEHASTFDLTDVDVLTLTAGTIYDIDLGVTSSVAHNQLASSSVNDLLDNQFSMYYGYRTGDGFVVSDTIVEDSMIVWNADAGSTDSDEYGIVFDSTATITIEDHIISGSANDTINLATLTDIDTIVFAPTAEANGVDTITGIDLTTGNDVLDVSCFLGATVDTQAGSAPLDSVNVAIGDSLDYSSNTVNVIALNDIQTLTTANFGGTASASAIKTAASSDYFVIADEVGDADSIMNAYFVTTNGSNEATVTLVGTISEDDLSAVAADNIV